MALLLRFSLLIALLYVLLLAFLYLYQSRMVFLPGIGGREPTSTPAAVGLVFEDVTFPSSGGVTIHGWYLPGPADRQTRGTLLFLHGNAGNISHRLDSLLIFHRLGLAVLIIDYQGYGRSGGKPSEANTYADGEAAYRYLIDQRSVEPVRMLVFGRSIGTAVAARVAADHKVGGLIIESGFTSMPDLAADIYPWLPARMLCRIRYDVRDSLVRVSGPVLVIHSRDDEIVPFHHGETLFKAAGPDKEFLQLSGGHNDAFLSSGHLYTSGLESFLERHFDHPSLSDPDG